MKTHKEQLVMPGASREASGGIQGEPDGPLVFVSHDSRDAALAEYFTDLLLGVSAGALKSFTSSGKRGKHVIEYGTDWFPTLLGMLQRASHVVCLLTARSVGRPWILFEAGVARGKLDTPVHGIAFGISLDHAGSGPFAQFHNCLDDVDSLTSLVLQLLRDVPLADPSEKHIREQVERFKKTVAPCVAHASEEEVSEAIGHMEDASVAEVLKEVKTVIRDLPERVRHDVYRGFADQSRRLVRRRPFSLDRVGEYVAKLSACTSTPVGILVMSCIWRDDIPWLYELGIRLYERLNLGDGEAAQQILFALKRAVELTSEVRLLTEARGWKNRHYDGLQGMYQMVENIAHEYIGRIRERDAGELT